MKLGEKLQRLRRRSGLSQEQLAARLTVSRQAVSKWELDDAMPDTENVIQLSRLFGVSCDYLLRDEVEEPDAPLPAPQAEGRAAPAAPGDRHSPSANDRPGGASAAPGETHLDEPGWIHNAAVLSLTVCAIGLLLAVGGSLHDTSASPVVIGLMVQLGGILLFELAAPRMGERQHAARLGFYAVACWLVLPVPIPFLLREFLTSVGWTSRPRLLLLTCGLAYLLLSTLVTAALLILRRRRRVKK